MTRTKNPHAVALGKLAAKTLTPEVRARGYRNSAIARRKLTYRQKQTIKRRVKAGETQVSLAEFFGVSQALVSLVVNGKR